MTEIIVYDFLCGQGKSTEIMNMMLNNHNEKYCYIAPYLTECHRFAGTVFDKNDSRKKPFLLMVAKLCISMMKKIHSLKRKSN